MSGPPSLEHVLVGVEDRVATVILNRADQRNPLSDGMLRDLLAALDWCRASAEVGVVVLTGAGDRAFCAGADLSSLETEAPELERHPGRHQIDELFLLMPELAKPA